MSAATTCSWTATSSDSWVAITSGGGGTGNGEIIYLVLLNLTRNQREATITIRNEVHRVTQTGLPTGNTELNGTVAGLSGSCPAIRFTIDGIPIRTDSSTDFRRGNCADVRNGMSVRANGIFQSDGTILASRVELNR